MIERCPGINAETAEQPDARRQGQRHGQNRCAVEQRPRDLVSPLDAPPDHGATS